MLFPIISTSSIQLTSVDEFGPARFTCSGSTSIIAPMPGYIRLWRIRAGYNSSLKWFIQFTPSSPINLPSMPDWLPPIPESFLFYIDQVNDSATDRLWIAINCLQAYQERTGNNTIDTGLFSEQEELIGTDSFIITAPGSEAKKHKLKLLPDNGY